MGAMMLMRTLVWLGWCVVATACLDSGDRGHAGGAGGGSGGSGAEDAGVHDARVTEDARVIEDASVCSGEAAAQADLLARARAAGCVTDGDCTVLGSCDEGFGFVAVPPSFAAETQALMDATVCDWFDGPSYGAACEAGQCVARENGGACGSEDEPLCANGALLYENPCVNASASDASIRAGCHTPCDVTLTTSCPEGMSCRATSVCPVGSGFAAEGCFQCDAITVSLCVATE